MDISFAHIDTWVFDLDNTLYDAEAYIFVEMRKQMNGFIAARLGILPEEANKLRRHFLQKYGTTLRGMMTEHNVRPNDFLDVIHDLDITRVPPCAVTQKHLAALPGRRIIFTSAPRRFAQDMVAQLGITTLFEDIFGIEEAEYLPKPHVETYHKFLKTYDINPGHACMFEDMAVNLKPAHDLGMTTVWLYGDNAPLPQAAHLHHQAQKLPDWLQAHIKTTP